MSDTTFTYDDATYSDLYKEAYGFRPCGARYAAWEAMSPAEKQGEWDYLCNAADRAIMAERANEWCAMERFESLVASTIESGAGDRETAVRWLFEAADVGNDGDFFCWHHGLPYGYFGGTCGINSMVGGY